MFSHLNRRKVNISCVWLHTVGVPKALMDLLLRVFFIFFFQVKAFKCASAAASHLWNHAESTNCVCKFITRLFLAPGFMLQRIYP